MAEVSEKFAELLSKLEQKRMLEPMEQWDFIGFVKKEGIPSDFKGWGTKFSNGNGDTVAHKFARIAQSKLSSAGGFNADVKFEFPKGFDSWLALNGSDAKPVAQKAGRFGSQFRATPLSRETVFEAAERAGILPHEMSKYSNTEAREIWAAKDVGGKTLAHGLAEAGLLPIAPKGYEHLGVGFRSWDLKDESGRTVADVAKAHQKLGGVYAERIAAWEANKMAASIQHPGAGEAQPSHEQKASMSPHEAASRGALPEDFKNWGDKDENGITVLQNHLEHLSQEGKPLDIKLAELAIHLPHIELVENARGKMQAVETTKLAHQFPETLPDNFELWSQRDRNGDTVAHAAVKRADQGARVVLPSSTEDWGLKDGKGNSVVDAMRSIESPAVRAMLEDAYSKARPGQFGSLVIQGGQAQPQAVQPQPQAAQPQAQPSMSYKEAAQAMKDGTLPADFNDWGKKNSDGWTLAHAAAALGKLPADFKDWGMEGAKPGITVAHIAMRYSELPASFDDWGLKDASGKTLGEVAVKHPKLGAEYRERIEASKQTQQPNTEARAPEPQAAKPSSEAQAQGGKTNQAAPIETSSTGRITGGGRFSRPPDLSNREPEPERRPIKAFISRGM